MEATQPTNEASPAARLLPILQRYWGYDSFRPLQAEAMESALRRRDSVVVLPTGGGKSLCFQAPALAMPGVAVVVSPLIALMKDQVDSLRACDVPAAFVNSTLSTEERRDVAEATRRGDVKLLYASPERLLTGRTLDFLTSVDVSLFAVDEAHCISSWGHDFRPEYRGLRALKERFPGVGVHAYTATASEQVQRDIAEQLGLEQPEFLVGSFDRPNLIYKVRHSPRRFDEVCKVVSAHPGEAGIVYCISRKEVDNTAAALKGLGVRAAPYHAGLSDEARKRNQEKFLRDQIDVMVATVAFGMGIDKPNVRYVLHAGMPKSIEAYQQESGRAGRDGLEAECTLLYQPRDGMTWRQLMKNSGEENPGAMRALAAIEGYAIGAHCRRRTLVRYFGQDLEADNCGGCDVCQGEIELVPDALVIAQKIVSCVARLEQRFGADYTTKVLLGSREQRILEMGHDRLSTYGLLEGQGAPAIRVWIEQLVGQGMLKKAGEYDTLAIPPEGWALLKGEVTPKLSRPVAATRAGGNPRQPSAGDSWEGVDRVLFDALRGLRTELAASRGVPPYIVFGDAALREMARRRPGTLDAFAEIKGVGQRKLSDFGEPFVAAITRHCSEHGLPMDASSAPAVEAERGAPNASAVAAFVHFRDGKPIEEVMRLTTRARSTVVGYLGEFLRHEGVLDPTPWVEPDTARRIEQAIEDLGPSGLRPIYERLSGTVDWEAIRIVAVCVANRG